VGIPVIVDVSMFENALFALYISRLYMDSKVFLTRVESKE
jgi:hypothetical protein